MTTVTVSTKFQVVIPANIRQRLGLRPGKKYQVISYGDCIEFVPVHRIQDMKGALRGMDTTFEREKDRV